MISINGMEILNEVTQMPDKSGSMIVMYVVFAIICTAFAGMCAWAVKENVEDRYLDASDIVGVCVLSLICIGFCVADYFLIRAAVNESHNRETIVYATIDETVPWTEINERYELIRQDGKIYQLRVKEEEK